MASQGKISSRLVPILATALLIIALVAVNVLAAFVPLRVDVTEEGLYTLSKGTRSILTNLKDPVTLKLYYSQGVEDIPVSFTTYSTKVVELLREYESSAPSGQLRLETYDPKPDTEDEEWATRYGLSPARLPNGTSLYFGLVAVSADREATVPFFDPRREKFLEYDISEAVSRVQQSEQPKIGVLSYLPIGGFGGAPMRQPGMQGNWAIVEQLQKNFQLQMLNPGNLIEIPEDLGLVLVVHPRLIPSRIAYALDQFVLRGGKLVALVDPNSRLDDSGGGRYGGPTASTLDDLFKAWGIDYEIMSIVGDHELATRVNSPQAGVIDYPVWVTVTPQYLSRESVITGELEELTLIDAGRFKTNDRFKLNWIPLITSSANSGMVDFTTVRVIDPVTLSKMVEADGEPKVMAALVSGRFPAAFPDGPPQPSTDQITDDVKEQLAGLKTRHLSEATTETSVVLIGDADFIADQFSVQQVNFFGNIVTQPVNDNLNLVLNAVEFLAGNQNLIHIRSRGKFSRPFAVVADLQVKAAEQFLAEEKRLSEKLEQVKAQLAEIERQRPQGENLMLAPDQLEALREFRLEEQRTRRALRDVRAVLRRDIEVLGNSLLAINLLAMPFVVAVLGFVIIYRRSRRSRGA